MSITLVFDGGFFVVLPAAGDRRKVLAYQACPGEVAVTDGNGNPSRGLEGELLNHSVDFVSNTPLTPDPLPMRRLSNCLNINYNGFRKVIGFTGGKVTGHSPGQVPDSKRAFHATARAASTPQHGLQPFKDFHEISHTLYDHSYVQDGIVAAFINTTDTRWWIPGYRIEVELDFNGLDCRVNGQVPNNALADNLRIEFPIDTKDCHTGIPHYEHNNPHVLEQPPTI